MSGSAPGGTLAEKNAWTRIPLSLRVIGAVLLGILIGKTAGKSPLLKDAYDVCKLIIDLLKALATPVIFFAVIDALVRTHISGRKGIKLVCISAVNACVAIVIGLGIANLLRGGESWRGNLAVISSDVAAGAPEAVAEAKKTLKEGAESAKKGISFVDQITKYVPKSIVEPFQSNNIITVVVMAVLTGAAMRRLRKRGSPQILRGVSVLEDAVQGILQIFTVMLGWVIEIIPFAILGIVAKVVGFTGGEVFKHLAVFLGIILLGLFIHAVLYYSFLLTVIGRTSPARFARGASEAIMTALSCGSSLATLPVTLRCLKEKLKISDANARLAACVGTNLNHDGIILYEAAATIFVAQAIGMNLSIGQQMTVAIASIVAGVGIAGIPEAGLITLNLVLNAGGIPAETIELVLPLLFTVDWIIGRGRATVNVISDMTVATLLERIDPPEQIVVDEPAVAGE